jgi:exosortase A
VASIVSIWHRSETFAHGYVVVPIVLWLVWAKRDELARIPPEPCWPAFLFMATSALLWMAGRLAGILGLEQFGLLLMIESALVAVLGTRMGRRLVFPLAFLVFAVPLGEAFVPWLIDRTADFTVAALKLSGVPVYREGNHFAIPSGRWSVIEACSGIRYLIASLMVGTLYAYLSYFSLKRRLLFVAASAIVPIVANWLRAYTIVMIGHLSDNRLAVGIDHVIYGWLFFGLVMLVMFWIGSLWREDAPAPAGGRLASATPVPLRPAETRSLLLAIGLAMALGVVARGIESGVEGSPPFRANPLPAFAPAGGWQPVDPARVGWVPHYTGSRSERSEEFEKAGQMVGVYVALYANQSQGEELVSSANQLVPPRDPKWVEASRGRSVAPWGDAQLRVRTARVVGGGLDLDARAWYWVNGRFTSSHTVAKALLALQKLLLRPDHSALILLYTPVVPGEAQAAESTLDAFSRDMAASIMRSIAVAADAEH